MRKANVQQPTQARRRQGHTDTEGSDGDKNVQRIAHAHQHVGPRRKLTYFFRRESIYEGAVSTRTAVSTTVMAHAHAPYASPAGRHDDTSSARRKPLVTSPKLASCVCATRHSCDHRTLHQSTREQTSNTHTHTQLPAYRKNQAPLPNIPCLALLRTARRFCLVKKDIHQGAYSEVVWLFLSSQHCSALLLAVSFRARAMAGASRQRGLEVARGRCGGQLCSSAPCLTMRQL